MEIKVKTEYARQLSANIALVYCFFKQNPEIKIEAISHDLGLSLRGVQRILKVLIQAGYLKHNSHGHYEFLK